MANTIILQEPDIADAMVGYLGLRLERGAAQAGPWTVLAQIPYVAGQTTYVYEDASGVPTSWYRTARYAIGGGIGPYSAPWPVNPPPTSGVTLADIERATARRVGPFYEFAADQSPTALFGQVLIPDLSSQVEQDLVTNLWLLRRGRDQYNQPLPVAPLDRQRLVAGYEPNTGMVTVDRPWSVPPGPNEWLEFHHLNPALEMRPAALAGLRRCFFEDRYTLPPGYIYETDLTLVAPWLDNPRDVLRVQQGPYPSNGWANGPYNMPFTVFGQRGHLWLRIGTGSSMPYYGGVMVTVRRPHFTLVNGLSTTSGPDGDLDELEVDLDYAAAAAHIEAWHLAPARLQAAAVGNLQASQNMAGYEFTRQATIHAPRAPDLYQFGQLYPYASSAVVNA